MDDELIQDLAEEFMRNGVAVHQRRCCIRHGVIRHSEIKCDHTDWDSVRHWCNNCGTTLLEIHDAQ